MSKPKPNTHELRKNQTRSEGLLWSILRGRQLCGLKFRRQHPVGPWIVDFACLANHLVVEIDGEYHDAIQQKDLKRQKDLEDRGWTVVRFADEEVEEHAESVAHAIATHLGLEYRFMPRQRTGSGMKSIRAKKPKPRKKPPSPR